MLGVYIPAVRSPSRSSPLLLSGAHSNVNTVDIHMPELHVETPVMENEKKPVFLGDNTLKLF